MIMGIGESNNHNTQMGSDIHYHNHF